MSPEAASCLSVILHHTGHGRPGHMKDATHREALINDLLASEGAL